ncbi:ABC transporter substrate-binding protein [Rhodopila sp.]|uniref:ABC transporter substrate-binding protein n=1 Tax=Rhodopila sp. TaxID=2480087 RepID=UPI003D121ED5
MARHSTCRRSNEPTRSVRLTRREVIAGAAISLAGPAIAQPAIAQTRTVRFTLPWLAEGSSVFLYAGKAKGIFARHGIDLDISRGFGSLAAGQAVASGQFEFATMISTPMILLIAKGLPLVSLGILSYDAGMGVGVLASSPITAPAMLAGRKIGDVPTSAEFPFFPAYAKKAGCSTDGIQFVNTDAKVLERVLSERQIDAMTGIASSSLPIFMSKNIPVRWMLYSSVGLPSYGTSVTATRATLAKDPELCAAMMDAICESLAFTLVHPDEATSLFLKALPEMALNPGIKEFLRVGMGINDYAIAKPDAKQHGLGYGNPQTLGAMVDLVMQYVATPGMKRPEVANFYKPGLGGKIKLTEAEWHAVDARVSEFGKYLS